MATANTFASSPQGVASTIGTMNGFFKEAYADKLEELIPDGVKLLNAIKFMPKD